MLTNESQPLPNTDAKNYLKQIIDNVKTKCMMLQDENIRKYVYIFEVGNIFLKTQLYF